MTPLPKAPLPVLFVSVLVASNAPVAAAFGASTSCLRGRFPATANAASATTGERPTSSMARTPFRRDTRQGGRSNDADNPNEHQPPVDVDWPTVASRSILAASFLIHLEAWASFASSLATMTLRSSPADLASSVAFWSFAAVSHPALQPALWISEALHASPGPRVAGLVPVSFLLGCTAVAYAIASIEEIRRVLAIASTAALVWCIGAGLEGKAAGDYDLRLDGTYSSDGGSGDGAVVRGCPAYDQIRSASVDGFDMDKYAGRWYWQKVHDYTQFKELYDTTLEIRLSPNGKGYTDDLRIRGPSPKSAPLSWDKSPLANGAHYMWSGTIDKDETPGSSLESGFGVRFPNYVVDVQTDPKTGEYTELIQFQCIQTGGVRLYEGIDFMSRSPEMSDEKLKAMHARAERAGLYPYGANPDQMVPIARRKASDDTINNEWQELWRAVGVEKALEKPVD